MFLAYCPIVQSIVDTVGAGVEARAEGTRGAHPLRRGILQTISLFSCTAHGQPLLYCLTSAHPTDR